MRSLNFARIPLCEDPLFRYASSLQKKTSINKAYAFINEDYVKNIHLQLEVIIYGLIDTQLIN